jgi:Flp pilus assembly protein TadG
MVYGNTAVIFMVIAVVLCVLGLAFVGMYYLNRAVDQNSR